MIKFFRVVFRLSRIGILLVSAALDYFFNIRLTGKSSDLHARALWLQRWCKSWLCIMHCRVTWKGAPPKRGLMVSNHLSYMDVLVLGSTSALNAATEIAPKTPVIFVASVDPVTLGAVRSYARPGANLTGVTNEDVELSPKRLELLRALVPGLKRVLFAYDGGNTTSALELKAYREAGRADVGKGGVVRDDGVRRRVVREVADAALSWGASVGGVVDSGLPGPKGNREIFLHLLHSEQPTLPDDLDERIEHALAG